MHIFSYVDVAIIYISTKNNRMMLWPYVTKLGNRAN